MKMYDYAADGLKRALPTARIGGPHVTGPLGERTQKYLRDFLEHCLRGTNYATGKTGSPLDYIGFHAKGSPRVMKESDPPYVRMGVSNQLRAIANGFAIVASYPELKNTPIIIGESDPEGCAVHFEDADYTASGRSAAYYVRALQEPTPAVNGANLRARYDADGNALAVSPCYADARTGAEDDCLAPVQERAWSSPICVDQF